MSVDHNPQDGPQGIVETVPAIARAAAEAWFRTAVWSVETSVRIGSRLARAALDSEDPIALLQQVSSGMRSYAREFLGISDLDSRVRQLMPPGASLSRRGHRNGPVPPTASLRAQGEELLRQAADVNFEDHTHPAYARILQELAPDEARILRLLALEGPQPMVDVRAANLIGVGSQLVSPGLNMIGAQAGVRHRDRIAAYLNNLSRLGLMRLSHEPVEDAIAYQVLEAQPEVLHTIKETSRAKTAHKSIRLTAFGRDFCEVCLPLAPAAAKSPT